MRAFVDETKAFTEPSDARMSFRTKARIKETIQRAAALAGVDDTAFTVSAAYREALETISAHERTVLQPVDHEAFFAAMDGPPRAEPVLVSAIQRYRARVTPR